jgi:hypothetical protein
MARKPVPEKISVSLSEVQVRAAIPKVRRRLEELSELNLNQLDNQSGGHVLDGYAQKINATLRDIYGVNSVEYEEYSTETFRPLFMMYYEGMDTSIKGNLDSVRDKVGGGITNTKSQQL